MIDAKLAPHLPHPAARLLGLSLAEGVAVLVVLALTYMASNHNFLLFHSAAELLSIFVAFTFATIAINCLHTIQNRYIAFIGVAYLFVGFLDVLHTLSYKGMPIFTDYDYYAPQFWIASRYLESISMLAGFWFLGAGKRPSFKVVMAGFLLVTGAVTSSILYFKNFPVCFVAGQGLTAFKVGSEYLICALMVANIILLVRFRQHFAPNVFRLLLASSVTMIGMELCFTLYVSDTMSDAFNRAGHVLKLATFYFIYKAVVVTALQDPINLLFNELRAKEADLERRVTERTSKLAESESRFRAMADSAPVLIWIAGTDKLCFWFNKVWLEFTGRTLAQEAGNGWTDGVHADDLQHCIDTYASAFDARQAFSMEYRLRRFDGEYRWILDSGVPRFDDQGDFAGFIGSCIDITERRNSERQVQALLLEQQAILNGNVVGMVKLKDRWFVWTNEEFARSLGYAADELVGQSTRMVFPSDDAHRAFGETAYPVMKRGDVFRTEIQFLRKDRESRWYDLCGSYARPGSSETIWALVDITERKAAQAELEHYHLHLEALVQSRTSDLAMAKEAAEAASRAKSTFLATMSHELRTPLNAITGMTALARMVAKDPKQIAQLGKVDVAARHLLSIINDILDIARIEANKLQLQEGEFTLDMCLQGVESLTRGQAEAKGVSLTIELAPMLHGMKLYGDRQRLRQILLNLVGNAVKFTDSGTVAVSIQVVEDSHSHVKLRFEVDDTGIGIAERDLARLFQSFEQADGSLTRRHGGTGLGLSISKQLVEAMGGEIGVQSNHGAGSTFWFKVRLDKADPSTLQPRDAEVSSAQQQLQEHHAGSHVLVAEDDPVNQEVARDLLKAVGLEVQMASNGAEAVEMATSGHYDLILMDLQMPVMDGLDATRAIRALPHTQRVPIIAMTANVFPEDQARCYEAGMTDFLARPVDVDGFFAIVLKWLEK